MNTEELDERINSVLSGWETPSKKGKKASWHSIYTAIGTKNKRLISLEKWHWVAAASLVAVIISYAIFYNSNVQYSTNVNEKLAISLPDGSSVNLNSESKASYNSISWYINRSVALSGEAFFKVKKGSEFSVKTNNGIVKVLGTSFNVLSRNKHFLIECYSGKVEIDNAIDKVIITKGEKVIQADNLALTKELSNQNTLTPNWISGNYSYAKVKLSSVFTDIAKQYDITIFAKDEIKNMSFTGEWNNTMSLEDVLQIVCLPFKLEAKTITEKEIKIQVVDQ